MDSDLLSVILPNCSLGAQGYQVDAAKLTAKQRASAFNVICKQNEVTPVTTRFNPNPTSWSMIHVDYKTHLWSIPRAWALRNVGSCDYNDDITKRDPTYHPPSHLFRNSSMKLRDHQQQAFGTVLHHLEQVSSNGIIELPTAWGKSCFGIFLAEYFFHQAITSEHLRAFQTLVVVTNTGIGEEWKKTIEMFCGSCSKDDPPHTGFLDGKHKDHRKYPNVPFLIATVQSLVNLLDSHDPRDVLGPYSLVIFDEAHHFGAEQFSKVNYVANGRYIIGLSATPNRVDGMEKALLHHLGGIIYKEEITIVPKNWTLQIHKLPFTPFVKKVWIASEKRLEETYQSKVQALSQCEDRNQYIANVLVSIMKNKEGRRLVAFSLLKAPLRSVYKFVESQIPDRSVCVYTGDEKKKGVRLADVLQSHLILTTYSIFGEGISCSDLNGMVVITGLAGKGKMEQPLGRALRKQHDGIDVVVVDFDDAIMTGMIYNRIRQYKQRMGTENMRTEHWEPDSDLLPRRVTSTST